MDQQACLPAELQGPATVITPINAGRSGAAVYRIDAAGQAFVLKCTDAGVPLAAWRQTLHIQQLAAQAELAPPIIHIDEARRAVVSAFVADRSFPMLYRDPQTHAAALAQLARMIRRLHGLPLPPEAATPDARALLTAIWTGPLTQIATPAFAQEAVRRMHAETVPDCPRPLVLSHNDLNPSNLTYDGARLLLFDWDTAGPNDPFYDLATVSVFLRMDAETCLRLLEAYDDAPVSELPARFAYNRRLVAVLCGAAFLHVACLSGHPGARGDETLDTTPSLSDCYAQLRAGTLNLATGAGQWQFGLALMRESYTL